MNGRREFLWQAGLRALVFGQAHIPESPIHMELKRVDEPCKEGESRCPACHQCQIPQPILEEPKSWDEDTEDDDKEFFKRMAAWIKLRACSKCGAGYVPNV